MQSIALNAPAKLNLTLNITGIAPNGYHTLDMVMHTVNLCDTVTLANAADISLACPDWLPATPKNLAWRAAEALREYSNISRGAAITLTKRIPAEAGMGGGSADAAAVLVGLNRLWGLGLSDDDLRTVGLKLGSDVPFAIRGGTARVRGVGDDVQFIDGPRPLWFLLAKPQGGVSTAECYRLYDALGADSRPDNDAFLQALRAGDIPAMAASSGNALEKAAIALLPEIGALIERMRGTGSGFVRMTGSGAAVFAAFETLVQAEAAQQALGDVFWSAVAQSYTPEF